MVTIQYQSGLKIDVKPEDSLNGKFVQMLLAGNNDGVIDARDFGNDETELLNATCDAFFPSPPKVMARREMGFREFVGLYGRIENFKLLADHLQRAKRNPLPNVLEIEKKGWSEVEERMTGDGAFTPQKIAEMAYDIYRTFRRLEGRFDSDKKPSVSDKSEAVECGTGKEGNIGFSYDARAVPEFLREEMKNTARMYLKAISFLKKYERIECSDPQEGPCSDPQILIGSIQYWREIHDDGSDDIPMQECASNLFPQCNR